MRIAESEHLSFDVGYQFGYGPSRTVLGSPGGGIADGDYEFVSHAFGVSVGWRF